jgi:2,3-bisphosphoglycerate-independent phosphoglycerate mutase
LYTSCAWVCQVSLRAGISRSIWPARGSHCGEWHVSWCGEVGWHDGAVIEKVDALLPRLMALKPDVVIVSGDHSSPAVLKSHSWHPVPTLLYGRHVRADGIAEFGERACAHGSLGVLPAKDVMPIALANAQRIAKFGA